MKKKSRRMQVAPMVFVEAYANGDVSIESHDDPPAVIIIPEKKWPEVVRLAEAVRRG